MTSRADFVAGNTRLRARLPALLGRTEYDRLAGMPRDGRPGAAGLRPSTVPT